GSLAWTTRTDTLCAGVLLAMFESKIIIKKTHSMLKSNVSSYIIFLTLFLALLMIPATKYGKMAGVTTIVCFLIVYVSVCKDLMILPKGRLKNIFTYLGGRSYSIYLIHVNVFLLTSELFGKLITTNNNIGVKVITLTVVASFFTILFAEINYRVLEKPLTKKGRDMAARYKSKLDFNYTEKKKILSSGKYRADDQA
ncbi:acyltransferase, partial [Yersinia sp. 1252 StPb PI]|uniref:acyltransferase family protein n=1 Tax=Yersinia sp. 1252 StPb PI TaxID=3117404 RepID=UPI003B283179